MPNPTTPIMINTAKFFTRELVLSANHQRSATSDVCLRLKALRGYCASQNEWRMLRTVRIPHTHLAALEIPQLIDYFLYDRLELAHLHFEQGEGFLVGDGAVGGRWQWWVRVEAGWSREVWCGYRGVWGYR